MGGRLDDAALIRTLKGCGNNEEGFCFRCPMVPSRNLGDCVSDLMLLAVQRLQALTFGIPDSSTKCLRFFEPMRIPTITQQEHDLAINRRTGKPYVHDSQEIKDARMSFKAHLSRHVPPEPFTGPLSLSVIWCFYDAEAHKDLEYKTTRPDTDNMIKMLQDEMAGLRFMKNDAQIAETRNIKVWSRQFEGIVVHLAELPKEAPECLIPKLLT